MKVGLLILHVAGAELVTRHVAQTKRELPIFNIDIRLLAQARLAFILSNLLQIVLHLLNGFHRGGARSFCRLAFIRVGTKFQNGKHLLVLGGCMGVPLYLFVDFKKFKVLFFS